MVHPSPGAQEVLLKVVSDTGNEIVYAVPRGQLARRARQSEAEYVRHYGRHVAVKLQGLWWLDKATVQASLVDATMYEAVPMAATDEVKS